MRNTKGNVEEETTKGDKKRVVAKTIPVQHYRKSNVQNVTQTSIRNQEFSDQWE